MQPFSVLAKERILVRLTTKHVYYVKRKLAGIEWKKWLDLETYANPRSPLFPCAHQRNPRLEPSPPRESLIRFYIIRVVVAMFPDLYGGGLESSPQQLSLARTRDETRRPVWQTLKNGGSLCISDAVNLFSHRFHGVLCVPIFSPSSFSLSLSLSLYLSNFGWTFGREKVKEL